MLLVVLLLLAFRSILEPRRDIGKSSILPSSEGVAGSVGNRSALVLPTKLPSVTAMLCLRKSGRSKLVRLGCVGPGITVRLFERLTSVISPEGLAVSGFGVAAADWSSNMSIFGDGCVIST